MSKLNSSLRNKKLLQDIRRGINQAGLVRDATVFKSNKVSFECMNDVSLTWEDAFTNLVESVHAPKALTPLDVGQMIELGHLLEACSSVPVNLLMSQIGIKSELEKEFETEVLQFFPVVHINDPENNEDTNIINIWQMDLYDESSINVAKEVPVPSENSPVANKPVFGPHNIRGRKPFVRKFPQMVEEATKFVRLHGYSAHSRRRESTAVSAGVSIEDVYNHLLTVVPGLRENGLSINTVRYMFCAPNKAAKSGQLYKGYVQARVPKKRNDIRKKHGDGHYLFSRVKYRREMASMFNDEVLVLSVECMNQLRLGSNTMVSRYHQNNKLYPVDDFPDLEDDDFPVPGYLGKPSGLMELRFKNNFTVNTSEVNFIELYEQSASCDEELCNVDDIFRQNVVTEVIDCIISKVEQNVENAKETIDENLMQKGFESSALVKDKHGRPHFKTPHTGPAHVYIRATKHQKVNMETHNEDIEPIINRAIKDGKKVVIVITDRGPDRNPEHYQNLLYYYRLWKEHDLDTLIVTSYAPGYSAYNSIEHLWSLLSKALTGVRGNPAANGEDKPPVFISGLAPEEVKKKEIEVFDRELDKVANVYWKKLAFDGWPVVAVNVPTGLEHTNSTFHSVRAYSKLTTSRNLSGPHVAIHEEFKEALKHVDRRKFEIIISKCNNCKHCNDHPVTAKHFWNFITTHGIFDPEPSELIDGSYKTFLEMVEIENEHLKPPETFCPSKITEDENSKEKKTEILGRCKVCPAWSFLSKTEKERHCRFFHPKRSKTKTSQNASRKQLENKYKCTYKDCGLSFQSYRQLRQHKSLMNHKVYDSRKRARQSKDKLDNQNCEQARMETFLAPKRVAYSNPSIAEKHNDADQGDSNERADSEVSENEEVCEICKQTDPPENELDSEDIDDDTIGWVSCDNCFKWFHIFCIGIRSQVPLNKEFYCEECI